MHNKTFLADADTVVVLVKCRYPTDQLNHSSPHTSFLFVSVEDSGLLVTVRQHRSGPKRIFVMFRCIVAAEKIENPCHISPLSAVYQDGSCRTPHWRVGPTSPTCSSDGGLPAAECGHTYEQLAREQLVFCGHRDRGHSVFSHRIFVHSRFRWPHNSRARESALRCSIRGS
jgi:hypothetical protein